MNRKLLAMSALGTGVALFCMLFITFNTNSQAQPVKEDQPMTDIMTETVYFGNGCFWCTDAVFRELKGVVSVESGYAGGHVKNPSYKDVCSGTTGHAEVIRVIYNPLEITYASLLEVFFETHDPTTLNRQGNDVGTQYRSVIYYTIPKQKEEAERYIATLTVNKTFSRPIVTKVEPYTNYYPAENYHQEYYKLNGTQPYCQIMIKPKIDKVRSHFPQKVK